MKDRVPVVPVHRRGELPFPEIRPTRDPEDSPWLDSFINLGADEGLSHGPALVPDRQKRKRVPPRPAKKRAA